MLFVVALTVVQPVHEPLPVLAFGPERTWMVIVVPLGRSTSRTSVSHPTEQAALRCLYLVARSLDPKGTGQTRWAMRWKPALNAFAITFADRIPAAEDR
jgi:hypothetical protein